MICLVCGDEADIKAADDGGRKVACRECGRYEITGEVLALREKNHYRIDAEKTQRWIQTQYVFGRISPKIDARTVKWVGTR